MMCFIEVLVAGYIVSLIVSLLSLLICCIYLYFSKKRLDQLSETYGVKSYFTEYFDGAKSYFCLFIPVVNIFISAMLLLIVFTDWGDEK